MQHHVRQSSDTYLTMKYKHRNLLTVYGAFHEKVIDTDTIKCMSATVRRVRDALFEQAYT